MLSIDPTLLSFLKTISTAIGAIGGALGLYTFVDNYLLKFRPKFLIADRIYFSYKKNPKYPQYSHLHSLTAQFEIFNHRNKLGRIEDLIIRLYDSKEQEAKLVNLYPVSFLANMPLQQADLIAEQRVPASSIGINNKSSKTMIIEFSQERSMTATVSPKGHLVAHALYKSQSGKWINFAKYSLTAVFNEESETDEMKIYTFNLVDKYFERQKLQSKKIPFKTSSYKGLSDFYLTRWLPTPFYRIKKLAKNVQSLFFYLRDMGKATCYGIYSEAVSWTIIRRTYNYSRKWRVTVGDQKKSVQTDLLLNKLSDIIQKKLSVINAKSSEKSVIHFEQKGNEILLKKENGCLKIYRGGDGYIYGQIETQMPNTTGKTVFSVEVDHYVMGLHLWRIGGNPALPTTIATRIIDYVSFMFESQR